MFPTVHCSLGLCGQSTNVRTVRGTCTELCKPLFADKGFSSSPGMNLFSHDEVPISALSKTCRDLTAGWTAEPVLCSVLYWKVWRRREGSFIGVELLEQSRARQKLNTYQVRNQAKARIIFQAPPTMWNTGIMQACLQWCCTQPHNRCQHFLPSDRPRPARAASPGSAMLAALPLLPRCKTEAEKRRPECGEGRLWFRSEENSGRIIKRWWMWSVQLCSLFLIIEGVFRMDRQRHNRIQWLKTEAG